MMNRQDVVQLLPAALPLMLVACMSCDKGINENRTLVGRLLPQTPLLGRPYDIEVLGNRLVVLDSYSIEQVLLLSAETGELIDGFGREGEGPQEFRGPRKIVKMPGDDTRFYVYDLRLRRLTLLRVEEDTLAFESILPLAAEVTVYDVVWANGQLVLAGLFPGSRLRIHDADGNLVDELGVVPSLNLEGEEPPATIRSHAFQGSLANSNGSVVALAARHADRIEIYDVAEGDQRVLNGPTGIRPVFDIYPGTTGPIFGPNEDTRFGYVDLVADQGRLYGLFSGRTMKDGAERAVMARTVRVFDTDGRNVDVFHVDIDLLQIVVQDRSRRLYGVVHQPEPGIVRFRLPER